MVCLDRPDLSKNLVNADIVARSRIRLGEAVHGGEERESGAEFSDILFYKERLSDDESMTGVLSECAH